MNQDNLHLQSESRKSYQAPLPCLSHYIDSAEGTKALSNISSKSRFLIYKDYKNACFK